MRNIERSAVDAELATLGIEVPEQFRTNFVRVSGAAEYSYVLNRLIDEHHHSRRALKCLVVGLFGGRDYFGLKARGHQVFGMDLEAVAGIPEAKTGNAEQPWPFADGEFDLVVMGEILEHLHHDMNALREARRVLTAEGQLIATVPFLDSNDQWHIRIHDPTSFRRLLEINGFRVDHQLERPGIVNLGRLNYVVAGIATGVHMLTKRSVYGTLTRLVGAVEWRLGHSPIPRRWLKTLGIINWGGIYSCSPSDSSFDYIQQNIDTFIDRRSRPV